MTPFGSLSPIPESQNTLKAQQKQMIDGHRRAQLFPRGHQEIERPKGISRIKMPNGDVFHYAAGRVSPKQLLAASKHGRENDVLDLGPFTKHQAIEGAKRGERPVAIVERNPKGVEVRAAAGTHKTANLQIASMNKTKSPGHSMNIEHPAHTIAQRSAFGALAPKMD